MFKDKLKSLNKRKVSLIFLIILILGVATYFVFAANGSNRPTYCLTCKRFDAHSLKDIHDYQEIYENEHKVKAGYEIKLGSRTIVRSEEKTEVADLINSANVVFVNDTLSFNNIITGQTRPERFDLQIETPSGRTIINKSMTLSQFDNYKFTPTESGRHHFYVAVGKGTGVDEARNWNGEHITLACGSQFPNGVYTFFVELIIDVQEYTLNVDYYTNDINKPIYSDTYTYGRNDVRYEKDLFVGRYIADENIPAGYTYDNSWTLNHFNDSFLKSGTTNTNVDPFWGAVSNPQYFVKNLKVKVAQMSGAIPVAVDIEYRLNDIRGPELLRKKSTTAYMNNNFTVTSEKIDDYVCKSYIVIGMIDKEFDGTNGSFKVGTELWNTPANASDRRLRIIFIYEEKPVVVVPQCSPQVEGIWGDTFITMKRSEFDRLTEIYVENATFSIKPPVMGKDRFGNTVSGQHNFEYFDVYVSTKPGWDDITYENPGYSTKMSFSIDKSYFRKVSDTKYVASLDVMYMVFCSCNGADGVQSGHDVTITIIENKPPVARYTYQTVLNINNTIKTLNDVYVNQETTIINKASDPNGWEDIDRIRYTFYNTRTRERFNVNTSRNPISNLIVLDDYNLPADVIKFSGVTQVGDLKLTFKDTDTWRVTQTVSDIEGLTNSFENTIKPILLNLEPTAILKDNLSYRYPITQVFGGKENRIIEISSSSSSVASIYAGTGVGIDHNKDSVEITPLDGQSIDTIYFENAVNMIKNDNTIILYDTNFSQQRIMFKLTGRYRIRLQVTDTEGNISNWVQETIVIAEDLVPSVTAEMDEKYYRNSSGTATISLRNVTPTSPDGDIGIIEKIQYRYDSNNDGIFDNEVLKTLTLSGKTVSFTTKDLGKYQFVITVKEQFGQPTIQRYITSGDYRTAVVTFITEVDNIAPDVTKFEIRRKN